MLTNISPKDVAKNESNKYQERNTIQLLFAGGWVKQVNNLEQRRVAFYVMIPIFFLHILFLQINFHSQNIFANFFLLVKQCIFYDCLEWGFFQTNFFVQCIKYFIFPL